MGEIIGLIVVGMVYGVMWFLSNVAKKAQDKQKQEAAERQRRLMAAKQQGGADGRAEPKKKYRQIEQLRGETREAFVAAEPVSPPLLKRESVFDEPIDGALHDESPDGTPGLVTDTAPTARQISEHDNPIAQEIMALMTTPQSMQQVVILSEIFNRPKYE